MYKQNGKRDSTYPLFSIRYNRRFVKLHIIASPMARHHYTKKIKKIPILLDSTSNDQPRKISTNARSSKRRRRKKNKDSFPSRRYQTTKRWSRALTTSVKSMIKSCTIDTKARFTRRGEEEAVAFLFGPFTATRSVTRSRAVFLGWHTPPPSPRRRRGLLSIYKCGSTWLRGRLVSSLLRVRAETVVTPPPPPLSSPRERQINRDLGGSAIGAK